MKVSYCRKDMASIISIHFKKSRLSSASFSIKRRFIFKQNKRAHLYRICAQHRHGLPWHFCRRTCFGGKRKLCVLHAARQPSFITTDNTANIYAAYDFRQLAASTGRAGAMGENWASSFRHDALGIDDLNFIAKCTFSRDGLRLSGTMSLARRDQLPAAP